MQFIYMHTASKSSKKKDTLISLSFRLDNRASIEVFTQIFDSRCQKQEQHTNTRHTGNGYMQEHRARYSTPLHNVCFLLLLMLTLLGTSHTTYAKKKTLRFEGTVLEKGRREPIEAAGVFIKELRRGAYTDANGKFVHTLPPGTYTLLIKPLGFVAFKKKITLTTSTNKTYYIEPDPNTRFQSSTKERRFKESSQQQSMNRKQLARMAGGLGGDPLRGIQNFPGIARASRTNGDIIVRGASFADTGFYVDGHKLPILYHSGAGLTVMNRRFLQRIEFFPGGAPLRYGRLTAGLVSIESRSAQPKTVHGEAYISFAGAGFYLELPLGAGWTLSAAMNRSYIDAFFSLFTPDTLTGHFWDYQAKLSWRNKHHSLSFFLLGSDDVLNYEGLKEGGEVPVIGRDKNVTDLRFVRLISKYIYTRKILTFRASLAFGFNQDGKEDSLQRRNNWEWPVELRIDTLLQLHKTFRLSFGLDGVWSLHHFDVKTPQTDVTSFPSPAPNPTYLEDTNQKILTAPALYLSTRWEPAKDIVLQAGVRGDMFMTEGRMRFGISPRLSASVKVHPKWRLLLATGLYNRAPSIEQWSTEQGTPTLDLQKAFQVAGGFEFRPLRQFKLRMQGFYNHMYDLITPSGAPISNEGAFLIQNYTNQGFGRGYGLELQARLHPLQNLSAWVTYTFSHAERGVRPSETYTLYEFDQPHILNLMVMWRIGGGWFINARFRMASGSPTPSLQRVIYDADTDDYKATLSLENDDRLPTFHQLDVRVEKRWVFQHWVLSFYLDLHNLYNARNAEEFRYNYNYTERRPINGLPFFPAFGVRGTF